MKSHLSLLYFLQFGVWGCYLTSLGQFLGSSGLGKEIAWFYAAIGLVSLLTPALMGHIADRFIRPAKLLAACHLSAACMMAGMWIYSYGRSQLEFGIIFPLYLLFLAFYMPTMALANTTSFGIFKREGKTPGDVFPSVRVWGTIGFIAAMWMVNSTYWHNGNLGWTLSDADPNATFRFQYNSMQLFCASFLGFATGFYALTLPAYKEQNKMQSGTERGSGLFNFRILKEFFSSGGRAGESESTGRVGIFLIFVAFTGVCMQISNGFATPFISHFMGMTEYSDSFAAGNATMLFSLSQISEALVILLVGKSLKKWGIGVVFGIGILAWSLRFFFFGIGNPDSGLIFLILSMVIYGFAFNFITIAGHLHMEKVAPEGSKGLGQGVMILMSNGIGATAGVIAAGEVINLWCHWQIVESSNGMPMRLFMGEWSVPWFIFTGYTLILLICWVKIFKTDKNKRNLNKFLASESF